MGPIKKFHYVKNGPQHKKLASEHSIFFAHGELAKINLRIDFDFLSILFLALVAVFANFVGGIWQTVKVKIDTSEFLAHESAHQKVPSL